MSKKIAYQIFLGIIAVIASITISQSVLHAEEDSTSASLSAQESVVINDNDTPLERKEKIRRNWVLYNDGTTVWALAKTNAATCTGETVEDCPATAQKRAVETMDFFTAFKANFRILIVSPEKMERFTTGNPITSTDGLTADMFIKRPLLYRLVKTTNSKTVYLDDGEKLRPIVHEKVFKNNGWNFEDVEVVSSTDVSSSAIGETINSDTLLEDDVTVKTTAARLTKEEIKNRLGEKMLKQVKKAVIKSEGKYYLMTKSGKVAIPTNKTDLLSRRFGLDLSTAVEVSAEEAAAIPTVQTLSESTASGELNSSAE